MTSDSANQYEKPTVILFRKLLHVPPRGTEKSTVWLQTPRNSPESLFVINLITSQIMYKPGLK